MMFHSKLNENNEIQCSVKAVVEYRMAFFKANFLDCILPGNIWAR